MYNFVEEGAREMRLKDNFAAAIRTIMERQNKSLSEFSEELDISRNALYGYLRGRGNPSIATLEHIAENLGISPMALMTDLMDIDQREIALLLLDIIQSAAKLPDEKRLRLAELFLEMVRLWNEE